MAQNPENNILKEITMAHLAPTLEFLNLNVARWYTARCTRMKANSRVAKSSEATRPMRVLEREKAEAVEEQLRATIVKTVSTTGVDIVWNLTQHQCTKEQRAEGVVDIPREFNHIVGNAHIFHELDDLHLMEHRVNIIITALDHVNSTFPGKVMIGGMPLFTSVLKDILVREGFSVGFSFTKRVTTEDSGTPRHTFEHKGIHWVS